MKAKEFIGKILNGLSIGIVVALIPNAVLSAILKPYIANMYVATLLDSLVIMQALVSAIIGILVGLQFGFNPMKASIIGATTFISSGVIIRTSEGLVIKGVGDLINVMIFSAIAVLVTLWLDDKLGSVTIVLQPIIGAFIGFIGLMCLPYVSSVTTSIGLLIIRFTTLQPLIMCIFITISFGIIVISPISTVAIGFAIGLTGLASGSANMGITVTAAVLVIGSIFAKNKSGVTLAVLLGAMKMMIPNIAKNPIMYLPIIVTSIGGALGVKILGITGTAKTAGFGIVGLIGPIEAYAQLVQIGSSAPIMIIITAYLIIPFGLALLIHILFTRVIKIYSDDIYKFEN
ncbi:PTS sugar transporter subunit IIC [Oceanivirga salmonicida]|uniref:PTS sugar transporter subunit IIC n=1 Tax=Oceanivirga salmonicida TaxID=1769291 RepID=UPI000A52401B|nr:PTS sugar transporter subunit IIC [Oceanivirga salmonicida]